MPRHATRIWCDERGKWCNHRFDPTWCERSAHCSLTRAQADGLVRIREDPFRWSALGSRGGGAIARMYKRLATMGLCTVWPPRLTESGRQALELLRR